MQTRTTGIILIALGIVMMIYTGFNLVTTEKVVDLGPLKVNKEENHPVKWSPIIGGILLIGGIAIIAFGKKKE